MKWREGRDRFFSESVFPPSGKLPARRGGAGGWGARVGGGGICGRGVGLGVWWRGWAGGLPDLGNSAWRCAAGKVGAKAVSGAGGAAAVSGSGWSLFAAAGDDAVGAIPRSIWRSSALYQSEDHGRAGRCENCLRQWVRCDSEDRRRSGGSGGCAAIDGRPGLGRGSAADVPTGAGGVESDRHQCAGERRVPREGGKRADEVL